VEVKDMTNADKIRNMTDNELAEWLDKMVNQYRKDWTPIGCYHCINYGTHHSDKSNIGTKFEYLYECKGCEFENGLLEWLKSESEVGEDGHSQME
jgi:hypothetical protein